MPLAENRRAREKETLLYTALYITQTAAEMLAYLHAQILIKHFSSSTLNIYTVFTCTTFCRHFYRSSRNSIKTLKLKFGSYCDVPAKRQFPMILHLLHFECVYCVLGRFTKKLVIKSICNKHRLLILSVWETVGSIQCGAPDFLPPPKKHAGASRCCVSASMR